MTMPEIMAHPWFQRNMPAGLLHINSRVDPSKARQVGNYKRTTDLLVLSETVLVGFWGGVSSRLPTRLPPLHAVWVRPPPSLPLTLPPSLPPTQPRACVQSEAEVVSVVREAQQSLRVIDADNIDEMADDILAEEEADDLLEGEWWCVLVAGSAGGWVDGWGHMQRLGCLQCICWCVLAPQLPARPRRVPADPVDVSNPSPPGVPAVAELSLTRGDYTSGSMQL